MFAVHVSIDPEASIDRMGARSGQVASTERYVFDIESFKGEKGPTLVESFPRLSMYGIDVVYFAGVDDKHEDDIPESRRIPTHGQQMASMRDLARWRMLVGNACGNSTPSDSFVNFEWSWAEYIKESGPNGNPVDMNSYWQIMDAQSAHAIEWLSNVSYALEQAIKDSNQRYRAIEVLSELSQSLDKWFGRSR